MRNNITMLVTFILFLLVSSNLLAGGFYFTCDVGGATIEYYDKNNVYQPAGTLPKLFDKPRYSYLIVRVSAQGYETFERGFENTEPGLNHFNIQLIPENSNLNGLPMMGFGGQVISRRAKKIYANNFKILVCNLSTYKKDDGQVSRDINDIQDSGWYSAALVNLATNKAVKIGDRIAYMVFDYNLRRCYGIRVHVINQNDIDAGQVILNILIM